KVIPIASKSDNDQIFTEAFTRIEQELNNGEVICIFPEGKITADGELNPFKPGIEKIIANTPVQVIPMVIHGLWGSFFSRKYGSAGSKPLIIFKTIWSKIHLEIGSPLEPNEVTAQRLEDITRAKLY